MTTTLVGTAPRVPLDQIHVHPSNPRFNAIADEAMVESIRALDLLQPLTIAPAPDGDGYTLIDGHRRRDGAAKAELADVPVHLRTDLVTEAQQIEAMAVTGLQHENLSPVEEAAAYEQLALLGMDEKAIAAATGFPVRRIKDRLHLNALTQNAKSRLHAGDATLLDVEALLDFADDPDTLAGLEATLGTDNFRYSVERARTRRDRIARHNEKLTEYRTLGVPQVEREPGDYWSRDGQQPISWFRGEDLQDPSAHEGCLGYYYSGPDYQAEPILICTDAARHAEAVDEKAAAARAQEQSEWEQKRAEREERAARHHAAAAARVGWIRDHFAAMFPTKSHQQLATAAHAFLPPVIVNDAEAITFESLAHAADLVPAESYAAGTEARASYAEQLAAPTTKPTTVLAALASVLAALVEDQILTDTTYVDTETDARHQLGLWDWLKAAGYPLSEVDIEIRTLMETRLLDLTSDEAEAS